ncbi:MAG: DUF6644 family protein [Acidobacteriota bacterium]|nr:DUF6644 family protein [Acidobacteriota bacterium]
MIDRLEPFFVWMQDSAVSAYFLENTWSSPIVQCAHLLAIAVFAGSVLIVDIRLLGKGLTRLSVEQVARSAQPWLVWSFLALVVTGVPQMISLALKQYYSPFFWLKMELLLFGLLFTFTIRRKVTLADPARVGSWVPKAVALVSMAVWGSVAVWARLIGLFS